MILRMPSVTNRRDSSYLQVQKRVPADVLALARGRVYPITLPAVGAAPEEVIEVTSRDVLLFSLRVREPESAKLRTAAFMAQLGRTFESLRQESRTLTRKDTVALAGEVHYGLRDIDSSRMGFRLGCAGFSVRAGRRALLWHASRIT